MTHEVRGGVEPLGQGVGVAQDQDVPAVVGRDRLGPLPLVLLAPDDGGRDTGGDEGAGEGPGGGHQGGEADGAAAGRQLLPAGNHRLRRDAVHDRSVLAGVVLGPGQARHLDAIAARGLEVAAPDRPGDTPGECDVVPDLAQAGTVAALQGGRVAGRGDAVATPMPISNPRQCGASLEIRPSVSPHHDAGVTSRRCVVTLVNDQPVHLAYRPQSVRIGQRRHAPDDDLRIHVVLFRLDGANGPPRGQQLHPAPELVDDLLGVREDQRPARLGGGLPGDQVALAQASRQDHRLPVFLGALDLGGGPGGERLSLVVVGVITSGPLAGSRGWLPSAACRSEPRRPGRHRRAASA
jgi:hypothetical protein